MEGLTRAFLKALGCTDDQISAITERHTEVTGSIKTERDDWKQKYESAKADADKVPGLQQEIDNLKGGEDFKSKYEKEHADFEAYKGEISKQETAKKVETAYRKLLADKHIKADKIDFIVAHTDLSKAKLDKDGTALENAGDYEKEITDTVNGWGGYIVTEEKRKAAIGNPPENGTGSGTSRARELAQKYVAERYGVKQDTGKE